MPSGRTWISSRSSHEPYVVIASGDCVYKMDYNKVLEYHIAQEGRYHCGLQAASCQNEDASNASAS